MSKFRVIAEAPFVTTAHPGAGQRSYQVTHPAGHVCGHDRSVRETAQRLADKNARRFGVAFKVVEVNHETR